MSAFPQTPRHSPHPSLDFQPISYSPQDERRQSKSSIHDPSTPLRHSFNNSDTMDIGVFSSGGVADSGGLGNLADELAGAFSDDEYYEGAEGGAPDISFELEEDEKQITSEGVRDSGVDVESPPVRQSGRASLSLPSPGPRFGFGHRRRPSEYDGSEYGSETDLESPGMPPRLVEKIDEVESLARRGTESSPTDGAVKRVTEGLRDLGSQAGVEGGTSRYWFLTSSFLTKLTWIG